MQRLSFYTELGLARAVAPTIYDWQAIWGTSSAEFGGTDEGPLMYDHYFFTPPQGMKY